MRFEIVQMISETTMAPLLESLNLLNLTIHKVGELQVSAALFNNCYWFKIPYETTDDTIQTYNQVTPLVPFSTASIQGVSLSNDYVRYRVSEFTGNAFLNGLIKNRAAMKTQVQEMDPYWQSQVLAQGNTVTVRFLTQMAQQNINVLSTLVMNYQASLQELYTKYQYEYFIQGTSSYGTGYHYPISMVQQNDTDVEVTSPAVYGSTVFYLPYESRMPKLFLVGRLTNINQFLNQFMPLSFSPGDVFVYYLTFKKPTYTTLTNLDPIDYTYKINVTLI